VSLTTAPTLSDLDEAEVVAQATGVLMVQYQLTHEQARTALCTRAGNAGHGLRSEAEAVITAQDAAARHWCSGPAGGVLDGRQLTVHAR
jgi:AmiR/NasT family two-component response regulator